MITEEELKETEDRARQATAGPWEFSSGGSRRAATHIEQPGGRTVLHLDPSRNVALDEATRQVEVDMDFIERAREDVMRLVSEVTFTRRVIDEMREAYERQTEEWSALYQENLRLKETLEFYANPRAYQRMVNPETNAPIPAPIERDLGQAARGSLGLVSGQSTEGT
jgi:hypothetical protein